MVLYGVQAAEIYVFISILRYNSVGRRHGLVGDIELARPDFLEMGASSYRQHLYALGRRRRLANW